MMKKISLTLIAILTFANFEVNGDNIKYVDSTGATQTLSLPTLTASGTSLTQMKQKIAPALSHARGATVEANSLTLAIQVISPLGTSYQIAPTDQLWSQLVLNSSGGLAVAINGKWPTGIF